MKREAKFRTRASICTALMIPGLVLSPLLAWGEPVSGTATRPYSSTAPYPAVRPYSPPPPAGAPAYTPPPGGGATYAPPAGGPAYAPYGSPVSTPPYTRPLPEEMAVDGLIGRPVGLAATIVGTALFIGTLPFSALGGNTHQAWETLVQDPGRYTFRRCLGCFDGEFGGRW